MQRTTAGQVKAADPSAGDEAVTKSWGDARYRNASNLNQGTIPQGRFPATISANISGSAATVAGHPVQSSELDTSDNALMTVGAFGLGTKNNLPTGLTNYNSKPQILTQFSNGLFNALGKPANANGAGQYLPFRSGDVLGQILNDLNGSLYFRSAYNVPDLNSTPWKEVWHTGNDGKTSGLIAEEAARADSASSADYATNAGNANNSNNLDGLSSGAFARANAQCETYGSRWYMGVVSSGAHLAPNNYVLVGINDYITGIYAQRMRT